MRRCWVIMGLVLGLFALGTGGETATSADERAALELSLTPHKDVYALGESVEFLIRVDNATGDEVCVPIALGCGQGYVLFTGTDPSGEKLVYECEIVEEFQGEARDLVCLRPGSFYGVRDEHGGLLIPGEWVFVATLYCPSSDQYPQLCYSKISSQQVAVLVSE